MPARSILILIVFSLLAAACSSEPETVVETVVQEVPVEVEVTRLVEIEREIEVTREVELPVEVTRIVEVERVVTATPEPTPEPTIKPTEAAPDPTSAATAAAETTPATSAPVQAQASGLRDQMETTRKHMINYGGQIDAALGGAPFFCDDSLYLYDSIINAPTMDVSSAPSEEQNAYGHYRSSIDIFREGAKDMANNCRELVSGSKEDGSIGFQQWAMARQEVNNAINMITPGIQILGGE